jgi:hypothetical protein
MRGGVVDLQRASALVPATLAIAGLAFACEPTVVIGSCREPSVSDGGEAGEGGSISSGGGAAGSRNDAAIGMPWSTGFEDGLCGYHLAQGYCYARHGASVAIVPSPSPRAGGGKFVAAFTVNAADANTELRSQARCVRQGVMPKSAYYGAWYFIPVLAASDSWNLFHFRGGTSAADAEPLWDLSLANDSNGNLELTVYDFARRFQWPTSGVDSVPIGKWFKLEIKIVRSAQQDGEIIVLQDGVVALQLTNLSTDGSEWGQWYVGNFAKTLVPASSTVYVDDVTIREER